MNVSFLARYAKGAIAVAGAIVVTATAVSDGVIQDTEFGIIAAAWATAVGVIAKANAQPTAEDPPAGSEVR